MEAAHASQTAMENAAPNSRVGLVAQYGTLAAAIAAANEEDKDTAVEEAGIALAAAANKSIDVNVVNAVNDLLGITMDEPTAQAVSDAANDATSDEKSDD